MSKHLLIDGRNILYRAVYAHHSERNHEVKYHCLVIYLRQIVNWINQFNPTAVSVFWDAPRITVWRKRLLTTYKNRASSQYVLNLGELLAENGAIVKEALSILNVRQYERPQMEADDLIYAASCVLHPKSTIIVSTDSDLIQIPYMISTASVYDPQKARIVNVPKHHPAYVKALSGDKADSIDGYKGIGPKKCDALLDSHEKLQVFLEDRGRETYHRNLLLTDLSLNPRLHVNKLYVQRVLGTSVCYDKDKMTELIRKYKIVGMDSQYANLVHP